MGECRNSSSFFWCPFYSEADLALRGIEHVLMSQCSFFFFPVMAGRAGFGRASLKLSVPFNDTALAFTTSSNTKTWVSWDGPFLSLEYRGFMCLYLPFLHLKTLC